MMKMYEIRIYEDLPTATQGLNEYADAGWRVVSMFTTQRNTGEMYVALIEKDR
jgi:hypothetical protein